MKKVKCILREWKNEIKRSEDPVKEAEHLRSAVAALNTSKRGTYGVATEEEVTGSTECWAEQWQQWTCLKTRHALNMEQATRYLGMFFNMDLS